MSVDTTMAVLYAQSGLSTSMANAAMVAPQAAVAMSRVLAAEMARQERQQIEKTEKAEDPNILPDGHGGGASFGSRRRKRAAQPRPDDSDAPRTPASPLVGNLLNVTV